MDWKLMKRASKFFAAFIIAVLEISVPHAFCCGALSIR